MRRVASGGGRPGQQQRDLQRASRSSPPLLGDRWAGKRRGLEYGQGQVTPGCRGRVMRLGEFDASLRKCLLIGLLSYVIAFGFIGGSIGYRERGFVRGLQGLSVGAVVGLP